MTGQTVGRSAGQRDEREGKGRRVNTLADSRTDQTDTQRKRERERERERESWRDVAQLLTLAAEMKLNDDGQTDDYRLKDFISQIDIPISVNLCIHRPSSTALVLLSAENAAIIFSMNVRLKQAFLAGTDTTYITGQHAVHSTTMQRR